MYSCMDSPLAWRVTRAISRVNTGRDKAVICETETSSVAKLECRLVVSSYRNAGSVPSSPVKPRAGQEMDRTRRETRSKPVRDVVSRRSCRHRHALAHEDAYCAFEYAATEPTSSLFHVSHKVCNEQKRGKSYPSPVVSSTLHLGVTWWRLAPARTSRRQLDGCAR